jgi:hypothetical protein
VGGFVFIVAGARRWSWVRNRTFRALHLAAMVFVAVETVLGITCPLTRWEDLLRAAGGEERTFIGRWLAWLLYYDLPTWFFAIVYCVFAAAIAWAWRLVPPRRGRPRNTL